MMIRRQGTWFAAQVGDDLVMVSAKDGYYVGLSEVGARIWELIAEPCSVDDICAGLLREFDVEPDVCRQELDSFLADLAKEGAIIIDPPA